MHKIIWILITATLCLSVWLYIFRLSYSSFYFKNRIKLTLSSLFGIPVTYAFSVFETVIYCTLPLLSTIIIAIVGDIRISDLFGKVHVGHMLIITSLATISAMSIMAILLIFVMSAHKNIDISTEMSKVRWISGINVFPRKVAWIIPMISACFEEVFFRGAFFNSLIHAGLNIGVTTGIVTLAFVINQCILADTLNQRIILGTSSFAISVVGCIAYLSCGSLIPSLVMHASFAGFYTNVNK